MINVRRTRSQDRILEILTTLEHPISAQDLFMQLRQHQVSMGLATVYRSLDVLKKEGAVQVRVLATGEALYSLPQSDRHHLSCLECGGSIELESCPVHQLEQQLSQQHRFKVHYHTLEFFGLCEACQMSRPNLE